MSKYHPEMQYFTDERKLRLAIEPHTDIHAVDFKGPGYYELRYSSQRCPRN